MEHRLVENTGRGTRKEEERGRDLQVNHLRYDAFRFWLPIGKCRGHFNFLFETVQSKKYTIYNNIQNENTNDDSNETV